MNKKNSAGLYDNPETSAERTNNEWMRSVVFPITGIIEHAPSNIYETIFSGNYDIPDNAGADPFEENN